MQTQYTDNIQTFEYFGLSNNIMDVYTMEWRGYKHRTNMECGFIFTVRRKIRILGNFMHIRDIFFTVTDCTGPDSWK